MVKLIAATECKGPSAFSSSHPPSTPFLSLSFFFPLSFSLLDFFAYIVFGLQKANATSKLTLEMHYGPHSR